MAVFVGLSYVINTLSYKYKPIAIALQGAPLTFVHNGEIKFSNWQTRYRDSTSHLRRYTFPGRLGLCKAAPYAVDMRMSEGMN